MASICTFIISTVLLYVSTNADNAFVNVKCNTENVGQYGQQSLLWCVVETTQVVKNPEIRVVSWKKNGHEKLLFHEGRLTKQPGYQFAEPSWNDKNMNVSLLISNTELSHAGSYTCTVVTNSGSNEGFTVLRFTAKYSNPVINSIPGKINHDQDGTLICDTKGGYPEGKIRWFGVDNTEWTQSAKMEVKVEQNGLFHLSSQLSLLRGSIFSEYTCVVFDASEGREAEATFKVEGSHSPAKREKDTEKTFDSKVVAPVVVIGSLIVGLLLALLIYRRRSQRARRHSTAPLMGDLQSVSQRDEEEGHQVEMMNGDQKY